MSGTAKNKEGATNYSPQTLETLSPASLRPTHVNLPSPTSPQPSPHMQQQQPPNNNMAGATPGFSYSTFQTKGGTNQVNLNPAPTPSLVHVYGKKSVLEAYILAISPFGLIGAHHFYLRRYYWGILYFFTLGLMGCGYLADWFRVPCLVKHANDKRCHLGHADANRKTLSDAYVLWFPMGLLGFHHYYLGNYAWGVVYTWTFGLAGIGWIVDGFRIPHLVREANKRQSSTEIQEKGACAAFALGCSPLGVLGAHHYYLDRPVWGILYTFTLGLMGLGWVFDWFRMPALVMRANKNLRGQRDPQTRTIDDAYLLWLPWGLLGFHHFYLGRPLWGILYFCTLGVVGMGWLVDLFCIPCLVRDANNSNADEQERRALAASMAEAQAGSMHGYVPTPPPANQGYPSQGVVNPAVTYSPNPPAPYPPQGPYYYQQGAAYGVGQMPQGAASGPDYPPAYAGMSAPQYRHPMDGIAPPPYQPPTSQSQDQALPKKETV